MGLIKRLYGIQNIAIFAAVFSAPILHAHDAKNDLNKCVGELTQVLTISTKEPSFKNDALNTEYQAILKDLSCAPTAKNHIPTHMLHFLAAVKRSVRGVTDQALEERAQLFTAEAVAKNGYLTGLTPADKITKVSQLLEQCFVRGTVEGSALESVTGNLRIAESLQEYILQPNVEPAELVSMFKRWALRVEAAEVFKELTKRVEHKISKHPVPAKYRALLRELEVPLTAGEDPAVRANKLSVDLVKQITGFSDRALYNRLNTITEVRVKKKGYLPGLTREYGIDSLDAMIADFKKIHIAQKTAIWSVMGNLSANDSLKRSFTDTHGLSQHDIAEDYAAWAADLEANELYKELFARLAGGAFKP